MGIYQACDIRGIADKDLYNEIVAKIAQAIGYKLTAHRVVVGGDVRLSTPRLKQIMVEELASSGCEVVDIGTVATPMFYYALKKIGAVGGVMITASHNPSQYNGFKLVFGDKPVREEDILEIKDLVEQGINIRKAGSITKLAIESNYLEDTAGKAQPSSLRVVVDAGNGATSLFVPQLFKRLGYDVIELYCTPDGSFPNRPPNPALAENLAKLGAEVRKYKADVGVAFDGDGDRVGFVDENGRAVDNDDIMVLIAQAYLEKEKGAIIYDAKCSMVVPEEVAKRGGRPVMARAGHTFSKAAFIREKALFAGEISGHFFFKELGYDDGMFAALKVCEFIANHGSLAVMIDAIPNYLLTPDIRVPYHGDDKQEVLTAVAKKLSQYQLNLIDGVRLEFSDGWGMIRASVTEPLFTLRFEAKTKQRLGQIQEILLSALPQNVRKAVEEKMQLL